MEDAKHIPALARDHRAEKFGHGTRTKAPCMWVQKLGRVKT